MITHVQNNTLLQQTLLLGSHHKVVRVILIVDNVFQINPWRDKLTGGEEKMA